MRFRHKIYILQILFAFICVFTYGQTIQSQLDSLYKAGDSFKFNGNVLVSENEKISFIKSYGYANFKTKKMLTQNSIFNIGSVTKQFTALGIVLLEEKGKLKYDDFITKYLPELKQFSNITIRNLLNHTSGIPNIHTSGNRAGMGIIDSLMLKLNQPTNYDLIKVLAENNIKSTFEPNTQYEYSNTNYAILATIIERISKIKFQIFLNQNILIPLKMKNTFVYNNEILNTKNLAIGYVYDSLNNRLDPETLDGYKPFKQTMKIVGDGNLYSTIKDLYNWISNFKKLISEKSFKEMTSPVILKDSSKYNYGFGFEVGFWKDYSSTISHTGRWPGYLSNIEYHYKNNKIFIELENEEDDNFGYLTKQTKNIVYKIKAREFIKLSENEIKPFAGIYLTENKNEKNIIFENGKLYVQMNPEVKLELKPISKTSFIVNGFSPEVEYEFVSTNGKVQKIIIRQPEEGVKRILNKKQ